MQNNPQYVTVTALNFYLERFIGAEELLHGILIMGEVSGASMSGGNLYFTLKDETAQIPACCFSVDKTYRPTNGERVLARGNVSYYSKGGKLSFIAQSIQPFGIGDLQAELEKLKIKLRNEGLFDESHKKKKPEFVKKLGVVTSINGAVISDIVSTIRKKNLLMDILVIDTKVQGEGAANVMCGALRQADSEGLDAIILARGGGSFEDLMPFNDEQLARTIYHMKTFIISAVGHETDTSISDLVADVRALTPTAGAELISYNPMEIAEEIGLMLERAKESINDKISSYSNKISLNMSNMRFSVERRFQSIGYGVLSSVMRAEHKCEGIIRDRENSVAVLASSLSGLNPARLLEKGFFKVYKGEKSVHSVGDIAKGDSIELYAKDGKITASVEEVTKRSL